MPLFKSKREKRLWIWTAIVLLAISLTLIFGRPLASMLRDRNMLTNAFWLAIILVGLTVLVHGIRARPGKIEIMIWLGTAAVYLLVLLRMAVPEERSHLIEYSVLAVFIHEALKERKKNVAQMRSPALLALLIAIGIGVIDECSQLLMPNRVFDPIDILFNTLAVVMAITASVLLQWARNRVLKWKNKNSS
ncbi:MAG: VanZ family protein [Bacteroidia bacterium]|nr:VanZ family protein [Bacteroidia bacterium]